MPRSALLSPLLATLSAACAGAPDVAGDGGFPCEPEPPAQPVACTMQWDPVCGCDGKTYGNACVARGAGVPHVTPGTCEDTSQ